MELLFVVYAVAAVVAFKVFGDFSKKEDRQKQRAVLLEKIRSVYKFITVEGDFTEVCLPKNSKDKIANFLLRKKKAIILVNAETRIGFDTSKIEVSSDPEKKVICLINFSYP
jgi:hypothetical protein